MRNAILAALAGLILALASACDVEDPNQSEVAAPAGAADVAEWLAGEWSVRLDLPSDYTIPPITWYGGDCLTWTYLPEPHDCTGGMYFSGMLWTDERIEVIAAPELFNTTLAHELLHWSLERKYGDSDNDHERPEWDMVVPMRLDLCSYTHPGASCDGSSAKSGA